MLEKEITVNGFDYDLYIQKLDVSYAVTLTPKFKFNTNFHTAFKTLSELGEGLNNWIIKQHFSLFNSGDDEVYEKLRNWDGVIEI